MKNEKFVHSLVHTLKDRWDLGARGIRARGLSHYDVGSWKDEPRKKISKIGLSWMKKTLDFIFLSFYSF
jgi:hypothetical protein